MTSYGESPGGHPAERPVERRLRQALAARADEITVRDLRPADPPGPRARGSRPAWLRAYGTRRFVLPVAAGLAAAATVIGYVVLAPGSGPARPEPPAAPPEISTPGPTPGSGTPTPGASPSPSPTPGGSRTPPGPSVSSSPSGLPSRSPAPPSRAPSPSGSPSGPARSSAPSFSGPPTGTVTPSAAHSATSSRAPGF
ncbi:hypothetical protein OHU17_05010 [Streptomyces goshikiensis]|uniref:Uncharacterized protein n=1 Tax=Streptomyces goshikiensis TaxID=1942 RepID=A0ABZ1RFE2_9ACTN|nr:hypothetical protein [Streptomyces goshikiensis]GHD64201.1 hypothetical protein GCM10010336_21940 [Streptomyces goshikiensis]